MSLKMCRLDEELASPDEMTVYQRLILAETTEKLMSMKLNYETI